MEFGKKELKPAQAILGNVNLIIWVISGMFGKNLSS